MGTIIPIMKVKKISLSDSLFSKVKQRLLAHFFNHPDQDFHTNEIIRSTHSGTGAVQRELALLVTAGVILVKEVGNQKRYQVNQSSPVYADLRGIIQKTFGLADHLRYALEGFTSQIDIAFIYGSIASHHDSASSDVDLMCIGNKISYTELYEALEKIENEIGRKINPTCYSPEEWTRKLQLENHFLKNVMLKEKIFIIGTQNELEKFGKFS